MATPARTPGLEPGRVAEIIVARGDAGPGSRASGYLVGDRWVFTAGHAVSAAGAGAVTVRFNAGLPAQWSAPARVPLLAESADVALLEVTGPTRPPLTRSTHRTSFENS
ncbi:hypothetical protein [Streptomyces caeruleatus]|uniref:Serine protease n=1 Tax=Streptomyces caeruleatus TaxID=661399 RepID=A0A101TQR5_9ACTN|nr:hypothetical protein [Streptomyces caeruleatus]KUN96784.1 hypothetical protein AQJ67_31900 [Streptomyces caeruleatus]